MQDPTDIQYTYTSRNWIELPVDSSLNRLHQELNISRNMIRKSLDDLDQESHYLYHQIIERGDDAPEAEDGSTRPVAIYWEIIKLVEGLAEAKNENRRSKGDDLAELALQKIARALTEEAPLSAGDSFTRACLLSNTLIQDRMVEQYQCEVERRLNVVEKLLTNTHSRITAEQILTACQRLDLLILDLLEYQNAAPGARKATATDIEGLYKHLTSIRDRSRQKGKDYEPNKIKFALSNTKENRKIIQDLQFALSECKPRPTREMAENLAVFYNRYLFEHLEHDKKNDAESFDQLFQQLKAFVLPPISATDEDAFDHAIRAELEAFIRDVFADLAKGDVITYPYDNFYASNLQMSYLGNILQNVHQHIVARIHIPLKLIRTSFTLIYYYGNPNPIIQRPLMLNCDRIEAHIDLLKKAIEELCDSYRELPKILPLKDIYIEEFTSCYNALVVPSILALDHSKHMRRSLEQMCHSTFEQELPVKRMSAMTQLLLWVCHMAVSLHMETAIREVKEQHMKLLSLFAST